MKEELDTKLCTDFPKIFAGRYENMKRTAMCWGFECGDGWYDLIYLLCRKIQSHIDYRNSEADKCEEYNRVLQYAIDGDTAGLREYYSSFSDEEAAKFIERDIKAKRFREARDRVPQAIAMQVKEKFGGLRFYIQGGDDVVDAYISFAESMSYRTCEVCGNPGKANEHGWIKVRCPEHTEA